MHTLPLKTELKNKVATVQAKAKKLLSENKNKIMGEVKLSQVFQGMRGITGILWETSLLDPENGIRFRGYSIDDIKNKMPHAYGSKEPLPEGLFYLMLTGNIPQEQHIEQVRSLWMKKVVIPKHVYDIINAYPNNTHPMTIFCSAITALQPESIFAKEYAKGISKSDYWKYIYDDAMNLIGFLPHIVAYIYRKNYCNNQHIEPDYSLDWAGNFAHMLGFENPSFKDFMRMYMTIHADHEGGNVSAHTCRLVGSALSDPYLSFSASMSGLAGPLHGLANQEVIKWIMNLKKEIGSETPSKEQIKDYINKTLSENKVLPGYGHAVLRKTDPRFTALMDFSKKYIKEDATIQTIWDIYEVAPPILEALGKVKNPWPNVDAHSGAVLVHYGMKEYEFYTVLFGLSRALGVMASLIWDRALSLPIERPKSITLDKLQQWLDSELYIRTS